MIHIPRIGQEVDRRLPGGRPRPADHRRQRLQRREDAPLHPPRQQDPERRQVAGAPSRGPPQNFNELRFEDKKGSEEIYFHAEKDFNRVVENNDTLKVGFDKKDKGDQTVEIFNNQSSRSAPRMRRRQPDHRGLNSQRSVGEHRPRRAARPSRSTRTAPRPSRPATRRHHRAGNRTSPSSRATTRTRSQGTAT